MAQENPGIKLARFQAEQLIRFCKNHDVPSLFFVGDTMSANADRELLVHYILALLDQFPEEAKLAFEVWEESEQQLAPKDIIQNIIDKTK